MVVLFIMYRFYSSSNTSVLLIAGMLGGLTVSFHRGENLDHMEASCDCRGLNITSQSPRHVGKSVMESQRSHRLVWTDKVVTVPRDYCDTGIQRENRSAEVNHGCVISVCQSVTFAKRRPLLPTERCHSPTQRLCLLQETFDPEVLFNLFLPPVIFHGAYTLNQKRLIGNLGSVLTFAFLGTSCFTLGSCVYGVTRLMVLMGRAADGDFLLTDCLLFGPRGDRPHHFCCGISRGVLGLHAVFNSRNSCLFLFVVAVLGPLSEPRLDLDLHGLLLGESVLSDAVAVVLTQATPRMHTSLCDRPRQAGGGERRRVIVFTLWLPSPYIEALPPSLLRLFNDFDVEVSPPPSIGITTSSQMGAGRPFDPPAFLLSVGYFLAVFAGSLLLGFTFTITTALISFHPLPSLCLHPKLIITSASAAIYPLPPLGNCLSN
ncbi:hypothetical protein KUCAC02_017366 [Chaenocephalus aceratus]|uniref:Uncharacterized protein n=1 Tax=Chaenocephalus aceratus TaxID=36190 RepID=A0ACB9W234_CHAAC|nr:hypothetical protein KUCAC02_017366 [Chaenocephalus aceratus]